MELSVNISKITPPHLSDILSRPRLLNLLENNKHKKLILVLGQAAQGKTTLVASYAKMSKIPTAWINLSNEDSDPVDLYHSIVQSLQYVFIDVDLSRLFLYPLGTSEPRSEVPLYRDWIRFIFENISNPVQIVFDDLHRLSPNSSAFRFLQILIEDSPANIHLIMLSREIPPLLIEFQNLKMRQEALILTNEELAFTKEEMKEFFKKVRKISFSPYQLEKIHLATEGWVGGLILFSESLSRFPESSRERFIEENFPDRSVRGIFQYFSKEILSSQPEHVQKFLTQSSIIDLIEPGFMRELLEIENTEEILREHVRKNLFVQAFHDVKKGWLFRYHQLFRDFLKVKLESTVGEEERRSLFLKAGHLYEQREELENAVKYFLEAKAYPQAVSVIERLGMDLLKMGRKADLLEWLHALPKNVVEQNPWLLLYLTVTRRLMAGKENVISLKMAYDLFEEKGDIKGKVISLAQLISVSLHSGVHLEPIERLMAEGETLLQSPELDNALYEKAMLWYYIGLGHIIGKGDIRKGIQACQNSYMHSKQTGDLSLQAYAMAFSALGRIFVGEFSPADETCHKIEKLVGKGVFSELQSVYLMVSCILAIYRGDFSKAKELVEKLKAGAEELGSLHMNLWIYEITSYLKVSQREFAKAEEIGKQYLNAAITLNNQFFKGLALKLLGLTYLFQGDFKKAQEFIDQLMDSFSNEAPSTYHFHQGKIVMGLICFTLKDYGRAQKELNEAFQYFSSISSYLSLTETHFALAFLKKELGKNEEASSHLLAGFKIAEERRYEFLYILGTKYLTKACILALDLQVSEAVDYASHLLSTRLSSVAEEEIQKLSNHPDSRTRKKVQEIRRKIHQPKVPRLRIETLGGFRVFRGDSLIKEEEWDRKQPKKLLMAMVTFGGPRIPKEILLDIFWPEERPGAAEKNFKTALQRLRKSLEPSAHKEFGSSYVHLQDKTIFLPPELCQVDADLFLSDLKKGEEREKRNDVKEAIAFYNDAANLYKGDFLPEELYLPGVDRKREELRERYIGVLHKLASLYERQGALKKAIECHKKAVQTDPLLEESYQKLMTLYSNRGMYNEALKIYEACKKALKVELKTKPEPMTTALYNKILEKIQSS